MELHEWLLFLHIAAAMIWVGGSVVLNMVVAGVNRSSDKATVIRLTGQLEWVGRGLIGPSAAVVIGLGVWLVLIEDEWSFSQAWIVLSLVLVAVSMALGMGYFGPEGKRITRAANDRGAEDPEVGRRLSRMLWVGRLDMLLLLIVLWAMVFKPGS